jgi:hypothetical protein
VVVGEEPFKKVVYVTDLEKIKQLAMEEQAAFEKALSTLREKLNEYAKRYDLGDLLNVEEGKARGLAEAENTELPKFKDVSFGVKALAALMAYREHALGKRSAFGTAARYWLEVGGSAWLLYYAPGTAYSEAKRAKVKKPAAVEELAAEALRRLFLKPSADHYSRFIEELTKGGRLALEPKNAKSAYVFRLYKLEEGGGLVDLGIKLYISKVGENIVYALELEARWRNFFRPEYEVAEKAAEKVGGRLPVEDRFPYMLGWVASDVAISGGRLTMGTVHLWQLAETHAIFDWSYVTVNRVDLTLEGPKLLFDAYTSLKNLDEAIR